VRQAAIGEIPCPDKNVLRKPVRATKRFNELLPQGIRQHLHPTSPNDRDHAGGAGGSTIRIHARRRLAGIPLLFGDSGERKDFYKTSRDHLDHQLVTRQQTHSQQRLVPDG